jgi:hypothetical protein
MLPHFDQAIPLSRVRNGSEVNKKLTGNSHFLSAHLIFDTVPWKGVVRGGIGRLRRQRDRPCPSRLPSSMASSSKQCLGPALRRNDLRKGRETNVLKAHERELICQVD